MSFLTKPSYQPVFHTEKYKQYEKKYELMHRNHKLLLEGKVLFHLCPFHSLLQKGQTKLDMTLGIQERFPQHAT